jgi:hypothetical protein
MIREGKADTIGADFSFAVTASAATSSAIMTTRHLSSSRFTFRRGESRAVRTHSVATFEDARLSLRRARLTSSAWRTVQSTSSTLEILTFSDVSSAAPRESERKSGPRSSTARESETSLPVRVLIIVLLHILSAGRGAAEVGCLNRRRGAWDVWSRRVVLQQEKSWLPAVDGSRLSG